ncbi:unnamed protein product, partial [Ectocarpus fasciculatus]
MYYAVCSCSDTAGSRLYVVAIPRSVVLSLTVNVCSVSHCSRLLSIGYAAVAPLARTAYILLVFRSKVTAAASPYS